MLNRINLHPAHSRRVDKTIAVSNAVLKGVGIDNEDRLKPRAIKVSEEVEVVLYRLDKYQSYPLACL